MRLPRWPDPTLALVALATTRALLVVLPGTWGWSLQLQKYVPAPLGWVLWGAAALALWPRAARAQAPALAWLGRALEAMPRFAASALAGLVAAAVFALPDRTWFTGDFLLRMGAVESGRDFARVAPQSLPLDLWLHVAMPRAAAAAGWIASPAEAARWTGAIEAGGLVALTLAAAKGQALSGVSRLAFTAVVIAGSALALMTGYGKTAGDLCLLTVAVWMLSRQLAREGRGATMLGLVVAAALASHRSALVLLPILIFAWWRAARAGVFARRLADRVLGLGVPVITLAWLAPRLAGLFVSFDLPQHLLGGAGTGGFARSLLDPIQWLDRCNVVLAYAPLLPLAWWVSAEGRSLARGAEDPRARLETGARVASDRVFAVVTWGPACVMLLLVQPQQGLFRDWDVFVIPGTLAALASAGAIAAWVGREPAARARAVPLMWAAGLGASLWLLAGHDERLGLARVRAFAIESPARTDSERGKLWEFLGDRAASLGRWDDAATALRQAVATQPSPRIFLMLAMAEEARGQLEAAEDALRAATDRDPADAGAFVSRVRLARLRGNSEGARAAAEGLRRIAPTHPLVREVLGEEGAAGR